jgi:hypothetical protein
VRAPASVASLRARGVHGERHEVNALRVRLMYELIADRTRRDMRSCA